MSRKVNQSEQASRTLGSINKLVSYVSIAVIAILLIISIFLISNTVSMGISVRKEEIGIMKYIGATDAFVRLPFLLEGILLGVIGAAIPLICLFFLYNSAVEFILTKFNVLTESWISFQSGRFMRVWFPWDLDLVWESVFLGSFFTTRKHLRV